MNRKPIFDAVRVLLGRGFKPAEVKALDVACDLAEAPIVTPEQPPAPFKPTAPVATPAAGSKVHKLGSLSEVYESGGRGPGLVSTGTNDPGGVSYGVYQLSSNAGTLGVFMKAEGKRWLPEFGAAKPGTKPFSDVWAAIGKREPDAFRQAQHDFIERTHYRTTVADVLAAKGLDLDSRHNAVRDATWSSAVQHRRALQILVAAIDATDPKVDRNAKGYDRKLIEAIYKERIDYVTRVAANPDLSSGERNLLISITKNRFPKERDAALAMIDAAPPTTNAPVVAATPNANGTINGNTVAAQHGVDVKSAAVKISQLHPAMEAVIAAVAEAVKALGLPKAVITSGNDSKHMNGSKHYVNQALDFRGNNIKASIGQSFATFVRNRLGKNYDVAFEEFTNASNNHLHVEYDPK